MASPGTGIDVTLVRIAVVLLTLASGVGVLAYAMAWLLLPLDGREDRHLLPGGHRPAGHPGLVVAMIPALIVIQIVAGALHLGYLGSFGWPVFLAAGGAMLIRRNASEEERVWINDDLLPMFRTGTDDSRRSLRLRAHRRRRRPRRRRALRPASTVTQHVGPCGRSAVRCWSSRRSWSSSVRGGSAWYAT